MNKVVFEFQELLYITTSDKKVLEC